MERTVSVKTCRPVVKWRQSLSVFLSHSLLSFLHFSFHSPRRGLLSYASNSVRRALKRNPRLSSSRCCSDQGGEISANLCSPSSFQTPLPFRSTERNGSAKQRLVWSFSPRPAISPPCNEFFKPILTGRTTQRRRPSSPTWRRSRVNNITSWASRGTDRRPNRTSHNCGGPPLAPQP